jgi:hypothetical protein
MIEHFCFVSALLTKKNVEIYLGPKAPRWPKELEVGRYGVPPKLLVTLYLAGRKYVDILCRLKALMGSLSV